MSDKEKMLEYVATISKDKKVNLFEAALIAAEELNLEVEVIASCLDKHVIERLKACALKENMLYNKKQFVQEKRLQPLPF